MSESTGAPKNRSEPLLEAVDYLSQCLDHEKCWSCGCFLNAINRLNDTCPSEYRCTEFEQLIKRSTEVTGEAKYDCRGCEICYPALAANALGKGLADLRIDIDACAHPETDIRKGWPPLPGDYHVKAYQAPVAICTLNSTNLAAEIGSKTNSSISIVGSLSTENLGIERVITNVVGNPCIRFLILCGADSKQAVGHLPGQSFIALAENGVDGSMRIKGARGRRPVLQNVSAGAVDHFLETVKVIDMIGDEDASSIIRNAEEFSDQNPGPARPFDSETDVRVIDGYLPKTATLDPSGYFVIHLDMSNQRIFLEHYQNSGVIDVILKGMTAAEVYIPAIENGLISRLDHAAYLGRELANAEFALTTGQVFVQDAAPATSRQRASSGCLCTSCC
jgi:tetrahydromethanopterin S-methyltransferase subunit A